MNKNLKDRPPKGLEEAIYDMWMKRATPKEIGSTLGFHPESIRRIIRSVKAWREANPVEEQK